MPKVSVKIAQLSCRIRTVEKRIARQMRSINEAEHRGGDTALAKQVLRIQLNGLRELQIKRSVLRSQVVVGRPSPKGGAVSSMPFDETPPRVSGPPSVGLISAN